MTESVTEAIHKAVRAAGPATGKGSPLDVSLDERRQMIAEAAYYRAEHRGFSNEDSPEHDWLLAEQEINAQLAGQKPGGKAARAH